MKKVNRNTKRKKTSNTPFAKQLAYGAASVAIGMSVMGGQLVHAEEVEDHQENIQPQNKENSFESQTQKTEDKTNSSTSNEERSSQTISKNKLQPPPQAKAEDMEAIEGTNTTLYYTEPAATTYQGWEQEALPLGDGDMGTKVFGLIGSEKIQFNEKSLWSGGPLPDDKTYNGGNYKDRYKVLPDIRKALEEGNLQKAKSLAEKNLVGPNNQQYGRYLSFGDISIDFTNQEKERDSVTNYRRELDLSQAISTTSYRQDETDFVRESFVSHPDDLVVMHLTQEGKKLLDFDVKLDMTRDMADDKTSAYARQYSDQKSTYKTGTVSYQDNGILLKGQVKDNQLNFASFVGIDTDGKVETLSDRLKVTGATYATLLMNAATDYAQNPKTNYRREVNLEEEVKSKVNKGLEKSYEELKKRHVEDYQSIFNRVQLKLTPEKSGLPTDELLATYTEDKGQELEELFFQYGRYLEITSSRDGENALPSNLQGIWNAVDNPPWNSDYHLNVNLQMNYWPAYSTNMAETAIPLINYVDDLRYYGRVAAAEYAGIVSKEGEENGWLVHTQATPFGWTTPGWSYYWGWSPASNAWIMQNVYDYYRFTKDEKYLKEKIYPMLKETAKFWNQFLHYDKASDRYVSSPSYSPEHGTITIGNTYDQSLVWELFKDFMEAAKILNTDQDLVASIQEKFNKLKPLHINKAGQIKEWYEEDTPAFTDEYKGEPHHRHVSQLVGLFPGMLFSKDHPEYLEAAKATLNDRGDGGTGWSKANKINLWARLFDGNRAHRLLAQQLKESTLPDLWDTHPPFQIDGNFGATSGMAEMLLQSHQGYISPLPALPDAWKTGEVRGLLARGNVTVDMDWENKNLTKMRLTANKGGQVIVDYPSIEDSKITINGKPVDYKVLKDGRIAIDSHEGDQILFEDILGRVADLSVTRSSDNSAKLTFTPVKDALYYEIERNVSGKEDSTYRFTTDSGSFEDHTVQPNETYTYRVRPIYADQTSSFSNEATLPRFALKLDDRDPSIEYGSAYDNWTDADLYQSTEKFADVTGNLDIDEAAVTAKVNFTGDGIVIYGDKTDRLGKANISIDGKDKGQIDFYQPGSQKSVEIARFEHLGQGKHQLVLIVSREQPTRKDERNKVSLDYFEILNDGSSVEILDDRDPRIEYGSAYEEWTDNDLYKSSEKYADLDLHPDATAEDATATLNFEGTGIQIYGLKTSQLGSALVWIDGVSQDPLDFYSDFTQRGVLVGEYTDLKNGPHQIKIQVSPTSTNGHKKKISLDRFVILKESPTPYYPASLGNVSGDDKFVNIQLPTWNWGRLTLLLPESKKAIIIRKEPVGITADHQKVESDGVTVKIPLPEDHPEGLMVLETFSHEGSVGKAFAYMKKEKSDSSEGSDTNEGQNPSEGSGANEGQNPENGHHQTPTLNHEEEQGKEEETNSTTKPNVEHQAGLFDSSDGVEAKPIIESSEKPDDFIEWLSTGHHEQKHDLTLDNGDGHLTIKEEETQSDHPVILQQDKEVEVTSTPSSQVPVKKEKIQELPQTGVSANSYVMLSGLLLALSGFGLASKKKEER